ncbi:MAG: hypothetical protein CSB55_07095 [Candidatus Cloacimonadota bacterium]|nr:MAG: hypothetical protein CSB55_07095 [Candidatus Cloacimonadota bacterium]
MKFFNNLNILQKILLQIIIVIIISLSIITYLTNYYFNKNLENNYERALKTKKLEIEASFKSISDEALKTAFICSGMPEVKKAYEIFEKEHDYKKSQKILKNTVHDFENNLKKYSGEKTKIHFHLSNISSLCRSWSKKSGDDLSSFRFSVKKTIDTAEPVQGIEVGRAGLVIRGIAPIFDKNNHIVGSVESIQSIARFMKSIINSENEEFTVFLNNDYLDIATKFAKALDSNSNKKNKQVGNFSLIDISSQKMKTNLLTKDFLSKAFQSGYDIERIGNYAVSAFPVLDFQGNKVGLIACQINLSEEIKRLNELRKTFFIASLIIVLISYLIIFFISKGISKKLREVVYALNNFAANDFTFTFEDSSFDRKDEAGLITGAYTEAQREIKDLIRMLRKSVSVLSENNSKLTQTSSVLLNNSESALIKTEEVASSSQQIKERVKTISVAAENTGENIENTTNAANKLFNNINEIALNSDKAADNISIVNKQTGELTGTIKNVKEIGEILQQEVSAVVVAIEETNATLNEIESGTERAVSMANYAKEESNKSAELFASLEEAIMEIGSITEVINSIAAKTNMLALNATIEAASAGEAGKGFAVVAGEVKELAKQTGEATEKISRQIECIYKSTNLSVKSINDVKEEIDKLATVNDTIAYSIKEQVDTTNEISRSISKMSMSGESLAESSEAAFKASETVLNSVNIASEEINRIAENTQISTGTAKDIALKCERVNGLVHEIVNYTNEISQGINNINTSISAVNIAAGETTDEAKSVHGISNELAEITNDINSISKKFKIES